MFDIPRNPTDQRSVAKRHKHSIECALLHQLNRNRSCTLRDSDVSAIFNKICACLCTKLFGVFFGCIKIVAHLAYLCTHRAHAVNFEGICIGRTINNQRPLVCSARIGHCLSKVASSCAHEVSPGKCSNILLHKEICATTLKASNGIRNLNFESERTPQFGREWLAVVLR